MRGVQGTQYLIQFQGHNTGFEVDRLTALKSGLLSRCGEASLGARRMRIGFLGRAFVLLLFLICLNDRAQARPSEAAFTRRMADRLRAALPGHAVEITSEPMQIRVAATPDPLIVNVGRVFN